MNVLVTGASGSLGCYVLEEWKARGVTVQAWSGTTPGGHASIPWTPVDLTGPDLEARLDALRPEIIVHLAAISGTEAVRLDPSRAWRINVEATARLARWSADKEARLLFTSTDLVFDGTRAWNRETDPARPILAYGRSKREAEDRIFATPGALAIRLSLLYGFSRTSRPAFFDRTIGELRRGRPQTLFDDEYRTPLDLRTAARLLIDLADRDVDGLIHLAGPERMTRFDLVRRAATALGIDPGLVRANRREDANLPEPRPADASLDTSRLVSILPGCHRPRVEEAIQPGGPSSETTSRPA